MKKSQKFKEKFKESKQKEIFEDPANKIMEEIKDLRRQIDFNDLTYRYKGNIAPKTIVIFKSLPSFYENIKRGYKKLEKKE